MTASNLAIVFGPNLFPPGAFSLSQSGAVVKLALLCIQQPKLIFEIREPDGEQQLKAVFSKSFQKQLKRASIMVMRGEVEKKDTYDGIVADEFKPPPSSIYVSLAASMFRMAAVVDEANDDGLSGSASTQTTQPDASQSSTTTTPTTTTSTTTPSSSPSSPSSSSSITANIDATTARRNRDKRRLISRGLLKLGADQSGIWRAATDASVLSALAWSAPGAREFPAAPSVDSATAARAKKAAGGGSPIISDKGSFIAPTTASSTDNSAATTSPHVDIPATLVSVPLRLVMRCSPNTTPLQLLTIVCGALCRCNILDEATNSALEQHNWGLYICDADGQQNRIDDNAELAAACGVTPIQAIAASVADSERDSFRGPALWPKLLIVREERPQEQQQGDVLLRSRMRRRMQGKLSGRLPAGVIAPTAAETDVDGVDALFLLREEESQSRRAQARATAVSPRPMSGSSLAVRPGSDAARKTVSASLSLEQSPDDDLDTTASASTRRIMVQRNESMPQLRTGVIGMSPRKKVNFPAPPQSTAPRPTSTVSPRMRTPSDSTGMDSRGLSKSVPSPRRATAPTTAEETAALDVDRPPLTMDTTATTTSSSPTTTTTVEDNKDEEQEEDKEEEQKKSFPLKTSLSGALRKNKSVVGGAPLMTLPRSLPSHKLEDVELARTALDLESAELRGLTAELRFTVDELVELVVVALKPNVVAAYLAALPDDIEREAIKRQLDKRISSIVEEDDDVEEPEEGQGTDQRIFDEFNDLQ